MGGCRCTFRNCSKNSSNSPGMHFFHFPYKNWSRCEKWALYSDKMEFLSLTVDKLRNKVICETHFRDECFMNYKKERLVQTAIPTLTRLTNDYILDYEESDNPEPKLLEPTLSKHLVPPEKRSSLEEDNSKAFSATLETDDDITIEALDELPNSPGESFEVSLSSYIMDNSPPVAKVKKYGKPKILNFSPSVIRRPPSQTSALKHVTRNYGRRFVPKPVTVVEDSQQQQIEETLLDNSSDNETLTKDQIINITDDELPIIDSVECINKELYDKTVEGQAKEIEALKQKLAEKACSISLIPKVAVTQSETITTTRLQENISNSSPPLSKAQLFNGIKKYLTPSMTALVRMEMFGGPERQWKPDEKIVARELLQLGDHVFAYVRDEWRFRLPPKKEVEQWLSAEQNVQDDEDL